MTNNQNTSPKYYYIGSDVKLTDVYDVPPDTEAFIVAEDHPVYSTVDGILYSKKGTILYAIPPNKKEIIISPTVRKFNILGYHRSNAVSVVFPEGVTEIPGSVLLNLSVKDTLEDVVLPQGLIKIEDNTFSYCKKLTKIQLPSSLVSIGNEAFKECVALEHIMLPDTIETIGNEAFKDCKSLNSIQLPANLRLIGTDAFKECKGLSGGNIVLPNTLRHIGTGAFHKTSVKTFTFLGIPESLQDPSSGEYAINDYGLQKIIIPEGSLEKFMNLIGRFSHRFRYPRKEPLMDNFVHVLDHGNTELVFNIEHIVAIDVNADPGYYLIYLLGIAEPYKIERVKCINWINRFLP